MMRVILLSCYTVPDEFDLVKLPNRTTNDPTQGSVKMTEQDTVQICVQGWIGERWANWFDGLTLTYQGTAHASPVTLLSGPLVDQTALRGILTKIWDLNLTLLSVVCVRGERIDGHVDQMGVQYDPGPTL
jgi:hypothetical protein